MADSVAGRPPPDPSPTGETTIAELLARKYASMMAMRGEVEAGRRELHPERLRVLARAYPGALRELDTTASEELGERLHEVATAAESGGVAPVWGQVLACYHGLWALAHALRSAGANEGAFRVGGPGEELLRRHLAERSRGGRIGEFVFARAGEPWGVDADQVRSLVDGRARVKRLRGWSA